jgi:IS30 family transposase
MPTDRDEALRLHAEGVGYRTIARQLGLGKTTIRRWVNPAFREYEARWSKANRERRNAAQRRYRQKLRSKPTETSER